MIVYFNLCCLQLWDMFEAGWDSVWHVARSPVNQTKSVVKLHLVLLFGMASLFEKE